MKKRLLPLLVLLISLPLFAENEKAPAPQPLVIGDSAGKVKEIMGEPNGKMESGDFAIYYYKLGNVKLKSGKVSELNLISEQEWTEQQQARTAARENRRIKGEELLQSIKEDPQFADLPAENRYRFWEQFRRDYPDVDVYVLYAQAKVEAERIAEKKREEDRLAALERRVAVAENEVRRAADAAEKLRYSGRNRYDSRYPQVIYYPHSYIRRTSGTYPTSHTGTNLSVSGQGLGLNLNIGTGSSQSTTTSRGFVEGPAGVMKIQSSEGFIRDFY